MGVQRVCVCMRVRVCVRACVVCVCVYACMRVRVQPPVKGQKVHKKRKKIYPPMRKKSRFLFATSYVICIYSPFATYTYYKFLLYLPHDNRNKRKGVGWASGRFQRIPTRRIPAIYGVYTAFIVN